MTDLFENDPTEAMPNKDNRVSYVRYLRASSDPINRVLKFYREISEPLE